MPTIPAPPARTRRLVDVAVLTGRNLTHIAREPLRLSDVVIQPVVFTLLFVYILGSAVSGAGSYTQFAIAGLLGMNLATSAVGTAIGLSGDLATGGFGLFLLFSYALTWGCTCLALVTKSAESAQGIGLVILFPLAFISNALVPTGHMPTVFRVVADWNPLSAVTTAARHLWANPNPSAAIHAWPMQHPVEAALLWSIALLAIFAPLAARLYLRRTTG